MFLKLIKLILSIILAPFRLFMLILIWVLDLPPISWFLKKTGLDRLTKASFNLLGMETFFTAGEKEIKSWPIRKNTLAVDAAGEIHSDIQRGFIKAEIYSLDDLIQYQSEDSLKSNGKIRQEGKSYTVQDGDIIFFKFNV